MPFATTNNIPVWQQAVWQQHISDRLRSASFEEIDLIVGLLTTLEELNGEIPADIYQRFTVADAPWQIKFMLENGELNGGRELVLERFTPHYIREINY